MSYLWGCGCVVTACLSCACLAIEDNCQSRNTIKLPPAPVESYLVEAETYLRHANEYTQGAHDLAKHHHCHATDAYYLACEAAWNAIWSCPDSPEILYAAGELYNESLAGLLESAQATGRLHPNGLWIGPKWKNICVPVVGKALPIHYERNTARSDGLTD